MGLIALFSCCHHVKKTGSRNNLSVVDVSKESSEFHRLQTRQNGYLQWD